MMGSSPSSPTKIQLGASRWNGPAAVLKTVAPARDESSILWRSAINRLWEMQLRMWLRGMRANALSPLLVAVAPPVC